MYGNSTFGYGVGYVPTLQYYNNGDKYEPLREYDVAYATFTNYRTAISENPTNEVFYYSNNNTINFIAGDGGYLENSTYKMKTLMVTPNSFDLFYEEEEK